MTTLFTTLQDRTTVFCEPEEFAHVVRFLASPLAGFVTGEIIDLNGGLLMD